MGASLWGINMGPSMEQIMGQIMEVLCGWGDSGAVFFTMSMLRARSL